MSDALDISIIIVSWNTREITKNCLQSIREQTSGISYEVIVIDNNSADGSQEMIAREFPEAVLIANSENKGFATANNQGLAIARGRYFLLLNSDTIVLDGAVQRSLAFAEQKPDVGIIGCRVLNSDGSLQPSCFMYPSLVNLLLAATYLYKVFPQSRFFGREFMSWWLHDTEKDVQVVRGCFMLVKREAYEQVGPMDSRFFMYAEETDWCYQFGMKGWRILFTPAAQIIHLGGRSSIQVKPQMTLQLRSGILQFIHKNKSYMYYRAACLLVSAWFGVRLLPWLVRVVVGQKGSRKVVQTYLKGSLLSLGGWKALSAKKGKV